MARRRRSAPIAGIEKRSGLICGTDFSRALWKWGASSKMTSGSPMRCTAVGGSVRGVPGAAWCKDERDSPHVLYTVNRVWERGLKIEHKLPVEPAKISKPKIRRDTTGRRGAAHRRQLAHPAECNSAPCPSSNRQLPSTLGSLFRERID